MPDTLQRCLTERSNQLKLGLVQEAICQDRTGSEDEMLIPRLSQSSP